MAWVYLAKKDGLNSAVKFSDKGPEKDKEGQVMMRIETELPRHPELAGYSPYVVRAKGDGDWQGRYYIFMEYANGVMGVHLLHSLKIINRDIKAANILTRVEPDGQVFFKLSGFGVSRTLDETQGITDTHCGTPLYMAPEVLVGSESYNNKVDIWAIGVIFYQLLSGTYPFVAASETQLKKLLTEYRDGKHQLFLPSDNAAKAALLSMLSYNPANRPEALQLLQTKLCDEDNGDPSITEAELLARTQSSPSSTLPNPSLYTNTHPVPPSYHFPSRPLAFHVPPVPSLLHDPSLPPVPGEKGNSALCPTCLLLFPPSILPKHVEICDKQKPTIDAFVRRSVDEAKKEQERTIASLREELERKEKEIERLTKEKKRDGAELVQEEKEGEKKEGEEEAEKKEEEEKVEKKEEEEEGGGEADHQSPKKDE